MTTQSDAGAVQDTLADQSVASNSDAAVVVAAEPHISLWAEIEQYAEKLPTEIKEELSQFVQRAKQLLNI